MTRNPTIMWFCPFKVRWSEILRWGSLLQNLVLGADVFKWEGHLRMMVLSDITVNVCKVWNVNLYDLEILVVPKSDPTLLEVKMVNLIFPPFVLWGLRRSIRSWRRRKIYEDEEEDEVGRRRRRKRVRGRWCGLPPTVEEDKSVEKGSASRHSEGIQP